MREVLGGSIDRESQVDIILQSLPESFDQFVLNYNMNNLNYSLAQLLNELQNAQGMVKKKPATALVTEKGPASYPKGKKKQKTVQK